MKKLSKILALALIICFIQSCNMSKHYGNMRISHAGDKPDETQHYELLVKINQEKINEEKPESNFQTNTTISKPIDAEVNVIGKSSPSKSIKSAPKNKSFIHKIAKKIIPDFKFTRKIKSKNITRIANKSSMEISETAETILWILAIIAGIFALSAWVATDEGIAFWAAFGIVSLEFLIGAIALTLLTYFILRGLEFYG